MFLQVFFVFCFYVLFCFLAPRSIRWALARPHPRSKDLASPPLPPPFSPPCLPPPPPGYRGFASRSWSAQSSRRTKNSFYAPRFITFAISADLSYSLHPRSDDLAAERRCYPVLRAPGFALVRSNLAPDQTLNGYSTALRRHFTL